MNLRGFWSSGYGEEENYFVDDDTVDNNSSNDKVGESFADDVKQKVEPSSVLGLETLHRGPGRQRHHVGDLEGHGGWHYDALVPDPPRLSADDSGDAESRRSTAHASGDPGGELCAGIP
mmetsp:Transcript_32611/g.107577  ORF Transcript_32611/g.107577 Transcript_32611/m.107577 type:complete len:119 (+) Transcript_32611:81-437(+)